MSACSEGSVMPAITAPAATVCPSSTGARLTTPPVSARTACQREGSTLPLVGSVLTRVCRFTRAKRTFGGSPFRSTPHTMTAATPASSTNSSSFFKSSAPRTILAGVVGQTGGADVGEGASPPPPLRPNQDGGRRARAPPPPQTDGSKKGGAGKTACPTLFHEVSQDTPPTSELTLLPHFDFMQPVGALEDFARLAAVRRTDDAVALHAIQNARGAPVAQAQMALQGRGRGLSHLQHQAHGVLVLRVLVLVGRLAVGGVVAFVRRRDQETLVVFGLGLNLPEIDHALDLGLGDKLLQRRDWSPLRGAHL